MIQSVRMFVCLGEIKFCTECTPYLCIHYYFGKAMKNKNFNSVRQTE